MDGGEALPGAGVQGLAEERRQARRVQLGLVHGWRLVGLRGAAVEGVAAGVQLEQAQGSGVAVRGVAPAVAVGISVSGGAAEHVLGRGPGQGEVDDRQARLAHQEVLRLEILVHHPLLLQVLQRRHQVLGQPALGVGLLHRRLGQRAAQGLAAHPFHDHGQPPLHHVGQVHHLDDVGAVQGVQHLELVAQGRLGRVGVARDLQGASARAHQVPGGVDDGHATLAQPAENLVVAAHSGSGGQVVRVQGGAIFRQQRLGGRGGAQCLAHGGLGRGQVRVAVRGAQGHHARHRLIQGRGHTGRQVPHTSDQALLAHERLGAIEQGLSRQQQPQQRSQGELVGRGLGVAERGDYLGRGEAHPLVPQGRAVDGLGGGHLLGQVESGEAQVGLVRSVCHQHHLGPQQAVDNPLVMGMADTPHRLEPKLGARRVPPGLLAVAFQPGGQRHPGELLQGQHDALLFVEGGICLEDVRPAAQPRQDLGLPAYTLQNGLLICLGGQRRDAVHPQHPLLIDLPVSPQVLDEAVVLVQPLEDLVLSDDARGARRLAGGLQYVEHGVFHLLVHRGQVGAAAEHAHRRRRRDGPDDICPRLHPHAAGRAPHPAGGSRREEHQPLDPHPAGRVVVALEQAVQDLGGLAVERQGAADGPIVYEPVEVRALHVAAVALDLHHEHGVGSQHHRVQLVDLPAALHQPRVAQHRAGLGQVLHQKA